jgi:hypothetical protein
MTSTRVRGLGSAQGMSIPDVDTIFTWRGRTVRDPHGDKVGKLGDVYLDEATDQPAYAGVHTGLFGLSESIVPLGALREDEDGLVVGYDADVIRDAPKIDPDDVLAPEEEERLARHYEDRVGTVRGAGHDATERDDEAIASDDAADAGSATGGAAGGMVRSEEEVVASRGEMRPAERVRIRKVLVTDHVRKVVPVRKEQVRLETEPAPGGDRVERVEE